MGVLLVGGTLWGTEGAADIHLEDGVIAAIGATPDEPAETIDVTGMLVLPGLVEAHCHLDKTLYGGPWVPHTAGDALADRISHDLDRRAELGVPDVDRIAALLGTMSSFGTTIVRSHTDVDPIVGLRGIEAVTEAAARLADRLSVQQVAFPQHGILTNPGTEQLLDQALAGGVEVIGGIDPAGGDGDPVRHLDVVFGLAERHGVGVDIHLHDGGSLGAWELGLIAERTKSLGLGGRVAVSHAYAFGGMSDRDSDALAETLADAGVAIVTGAVYDFPVPPVKKLRAAGVTVACGHDGIRDLWGPYGSGDMLERARQVAYRSTFRRDDDIELALHAATYGGRALLGLPADPVGVGSAADLVVVDVPTAAEAVVTVPERRLVIRAGRVVGGSLAH